MSFFKKNSKATIFLRIKLLKNRKTQKEDYYDLSSISRKKVFKKKESIPFFSFIDLFLFFEINYEKIELTFFIFYSVFMKIL
jgi:hypothetical protein